jgi:hypothetical protein
LTYSASKAERDNFFRVPRGETKNFEEENSMPCETLSAKRQRRRNKTGNLQTIRTFDLALNQEKICIFPSTRLSIFESGFLEVKKHMNG